MNGPLRVAAACPTCGASVEFEEGSQIFRCDYCGSVLWITGYQQTLTYHILPKLSRPAAARAGVRALREQFPGFHLEEIALSFIPYYRYSGITCWLDEEETEALSEEDENARRNALLWASEAGHGSSVDMERTQWVLKGRREEKNFIGTELSVAGLYSLGVRASVLPLSVFQPELLQKEGALFPVTQSEKNAMEIGQKSEGRRHQAIGGRLSLIYFPFYLALCRKGEASVTLFVDGVSGEVAGSHEDEIQLPAPKGGDVFSTLRFRPLKCPNCGWNLPSRPQDV
ncbi:MAG TPA: hypothetical protein VFG95_03670, partial [Nitrospiria bacterium]|nr:hypothetical protein [Nitrospiria bacterium]